MKKIILATAVALIGCGGETTSPPKEYLYTFNRYGVNKGENQANITFRLRTLLDYKKKVFTDLELALLLDLAPTIAEEAFSLIPSLKHKLKAEQMNEYLNKLNSEIKTNY